MASRVDFAVSATPIYSYTGQAEAPDVDTIAADVGKSLSGSASVTTTHDTDGYTSGTPDYDEAEVSTGADNTLGSSGYDFVFIKNTGYQYDGGALGEVSAGNLVVTLGSQQVCTLPAGGAIILPTVPAVAIKVKSDSGTDNIAVEFILST